MVGLVLDDVERRHRQARENRDDGDDHEEFDQGETLVDLGFHGMDCVWVMLYYGRRARFRATVSWMIRQGWGEIDQKKVGE